MQKPQTLSQFKSDVNKAKELFVWVEFGITPDGATLGGYIVTYKTQVISLIKQYEYAHKWSAKAYYRFDPESKQLYVEGFAIPS